MSFLSLPDEMLEMIFKEFNSLNEMLKCRRLSKRCKKVVDDIRITDSLAVNVYGASSWVKAQIIRELTGPTNVKFKTRNLNFLKREPIKTMLLGLKKLAIWHVSFESKREFRKFQESINQLKQLEHLLIRKIDIDGAIFQLDHVRTLTILDCRNLDIFLMANKLVKLLLPLQRPSLMYGRTCLTAIKDIILRHPSLRELEVELTTTSEVHEILKQKKIARNLSLAIYFSGWAVNNLDDLIGYQQRPFNIPLPYIVENFERFRSIDWNHQVNYSELIGYSGRLSANAFLSKFIGIREVAVGEIVDSEAEFIEFLKKCKNLDQLTITRSQFGQAFYDDLHTHCAKLQFLKIELEHSQQIDPNFLSNHRLKKLDINRDLGSTLISHLVAWREVSFLRFQLNGRLLEIFQSYDGLKLTFKGHVFHYRYHDNRHYNFAEALKSLSELVL